MKKSKFQEIMGETFNIPVESAQEILLPQKTSNNSIMAVADTPSMPDPELDKDIEFARDNLRIAINTATDAIQNLGDLASSSESAGHFTAIANLVKSTSDAAALLVNIHKQKKDIKKVDPVAGHPGEAKTVNNNLFVGTTAELQKLVRPRD